MTPDSEPIEPTDDLQFDTAEEAEGDAVAAPAQSCMACQRPITSAYFAVRDKMVCSACRDLLIAPAPGTPLGRVLKAVVLGLGAGLAGAVMWFAVRRAIHLEIGLVAILVGFMVGNAVRKGSGNRGGRGYQVLAVVLTYCCISANYMPDVVEALFAVAQKHRVVTTHDAGGDASTAADSSRNMTTPNSTASPHKKIGLLKGLGALVLLIAITFGIAMAAPFLGGAQNLIGLLIIGFALLQAWKLNKPRSLAITGPYQLGSPAFGARP